jgi:hypothetical protein
MRKTVVRRGSSIVAVAALVCSFAWLASAGPASASTASAGDDASFRAAYADVTTPVTVINLTADIQMNCSKGVFYRGGSSPADDVTVNGNGHTITAAGCNAQVILNSGNGSLTLNGVTVTGGNLTDTCSIGGGGIQSNGDIHLIDSQVVGNTTTTTADDSACAVLGGGITVSDSSTVTMVNSTVSDNHAVCSSACGDAVGGGIYAHNDTVTMQNSTLSDNTTSASGSTVGGGLDAENVTLVYSTVARNTAKTGANFELENTTVDNGPVVLTTFASVIALPQGGGLNCTASTSNVTKTSNGYSFDDDGSCVVGSATGDMSDAGDPGLGTLADNGGLTQTLLPQTNSPLIDAVATADCSSDGASTIVPLVDQRDYPRPFGSGCDIGAVEVQPPPTTTTTTSTTQGSGATTTTTPATGAVQASPQFTG